MRGITPWVSRISGCASVEFYFPNSVSAMRGGRKGEGGNRSGGTGVGEEERVGGQKVRFVCAFLLQPPSFHCSQPHSALLTSETETLLGTY